MSEFLYNIISEPLDYQFMVNSLIAIAMICLTCGLVSSFLILKGWSLYGDALSHAVLPGIIVSLLLGVPIGIGIFACALLVTFTIQYFREHTVNKEQTVLSYVTSSFMGIGFLLYYAFPPGVRINEILFGKIVGITHLDLLGLGLVTLFILGVIITAWKTLALVFFDKTTAFLLGIKVRAYEVIFYVLLSVAVMSSIRTVGSLLIVSLLIVPGSLAYILTKELKTMFYISGIFSLVTGVVGLYASYHLDLSTGAAIISLQFVLFLVVFFVKFVGLRWQIARQAQHAEPQPTLTDTTDTTNNTVSVATTSPANITTQTKTPTSKNSSEQATTAIQPHSNSNNSATPHTGGSGINLATAYRQHEEQPRS